MAVVVQDVSSLKPNPGEIVSFVGDGSVALVVSYRHKRLYVLSADPVLFYAERSGYYLRYVRDVMLALSLIPFRM